MSDRNYRDSGSKTRRASRPPFGLSAWGRGVWAELLAENDFAPHELVTLTRSLRWFDISDRFLADAEQLQGREHAAKVKSAGDASATALRLWKALKWTDPSAPTRNPGRPAKPKWHPLSRLPEDV